MFTKKEPSSDLLQYTISPKDEVEITESIEIVPLKTTSLSSGSKLGWFLLFIMLFSFALFLSLFILFVGFSQKI